MKAPTPRHENETPPAVGSMRWAINARRFYRVAAECLGPYGRDLDGDTHADAARAALQLDNPTYSLWTPPGSRIEVYRHGTQSAIGCAFLNDRQTFIFNRGELTPGEQ